MKKLNIKKKFLALLISGNILLTGCSMSGKMTSKEQSSSDSSYSYSSIDENESIYEESSNIENSSKQENNQSNIIDESSLEESIEQSIMECSTEEESIEESIIENSTEEESLIEVDEISDEESIIEISESDNSIEISDEESYEEESEISEETSIEDNEESIIQEESIEESIIENSTAEEIMEESMEDDSNDIYTDDDKYIIANNYVNIRNKPNPDSEILGLLYKNDTLKKLGYTDEYYIVEYNGKKAYVSMDCTYEIDKDIIINNPKLNINDICYFPNGSTLYSDKELTKEIKNIPSLELGEIYYKDDNTYYIETEGQKGYVSKNTATIISQPVVVVDESDQISTLFKNNEKKLEFPVVTGDINTPTTKGLSEIYYVSYGATLAGDTWEVDVGVFMPFTIWGEGFHDAWWRSDSEFGGTTYQGNGSHGCVNCKYNDAMALAYEVKDSMDNGNKCKVLVKR